MPYRWFKHVLAVAALGGALACDNLPAGLARFEGRFQFLAVDSGGRPALSGTWWLDVHADSTVTGTFEIFLLRSASDPGTLVGSVHGDTLWLWLDPNPDGGVMFHGRAASTGVAGTWWYNTIAGPQGGGSFVAARQSTRLPTMP